MWVWKQRQTNPDYQIPDGLDVCHRNDVTRELYDCNPDNLWLGTHSDNMRDKMLKDRGNHAAGDRNGRKTKPQNWPIGDRHHFRLHPELICRGERSGRAKLNWAQVKEIRALCMTGDLTQKAVADRFGVSQSAIGAITTGKTWAAGYEPPAAHELNYDVTVGRPSSG
jgi:hypothetical protein